MATVLSEPIERGWKLIGSVRRNAAGLMPRRVQMGGTGLEPIARLLALTRSRNWRYGDVKVADADHPQRSAAAGSDRLASAPERPSS